MDHVSRCRWSMYVVFLKSGQKPRYHLKTDIEVVAAVAVMKADDDFDDGELLSSHVSYRAVSGKRYSMIIDQFESVIVWT